MRLTEEGLRLEINGMDLFLWGLGFQVLFLWGGSLGGLGV